MNKTLQLYNLDYSKTLLHIQDNFHLTNALSDEMLKIIESVRGSFFTYTNSPVEVENIHQFRYSINNRVINTKDISILIWNYIKKNNKTACFFDDVIRNPGDSDLDDEYKQCGFSYNKEIYYKISQDNLSIDLIMDCLDVSSATWHSLCVLTTFNECKTETGILTLEMIKQICEQTEIAIIGAYDDEGYIFWQRDHDPIQNS